jgi:hypothetical protein
MLFQGEYTQENDYIAAANRGRSWNAKVKEEETTRAWAEVKNNYAPIPADAYPLIYTYHWYWKNAKVDPGNIAFAEKYIADGIQLAGITRGDGWNDVAEIHHYFSIDNKKPRVELTLSWSDDPNKVQPKRSITKRV